jgi:hypothetical protein
VGFNTPPLCGVGNLRRLFTAAELLGEAGFYESASNFFEKNRELTAKVTNKITFSYQFMPVHRALRCIVNVPEICHNQIKKIWKRKRASTLNQLSPTIPSYAIARPSSNILNTIRKAQTETFWQIRERFKLWISQDVIDEIGGGDKDAARRRLEFVKGIELLPKPDGLDVLATVYKKLLDIPDRAKQDCSHLAYCVLNRIDYLLSWNCTHLGSVAQGKASIYNDKHGLWMPSLVTPEILYSMEKEKHDTR